MADSRSLHFKLKGHRESVIRLSAQFHTLIHLGVASIGADTNLDRSIFNSVPHMLTYSFRNTTTS